MSVFPVRFCLSVVLCWALTLAFAAAAKIPYTSSAELITGETLYATTAPAQWLVQRTVERAGHCAFTPQEVLTSFDDLVRWWSIASVPRAATPPSGRSMS